MGDVARDHARTRSRKARSSLECVPMPGKPGRGGLRRKAHGCVPQVLSAKFSIRVPRAFAKFVYRFSIWYISTLRMANIYLSIVYWLSELYVTLLTRNFINTEATFSRKKWTHKFVNVSRRVQKERSSCNLVKRCYRNLNQRNRAFRLAVGYIYCQSLEIIKVCLCDPQSRRHATISRSFESRSISMQYSFRDRRVE